MKAIWNDTIIAEAPQDALIRIEGNWYFPTDSLKHEFFTKSETHTTCFWKGEANYYTIVVKGDANEDAAWYYPEPQAGSIEKVGKDFTNFVAFWHGVTIAD